MATLQLWLENGSLRTPLNVDGATPAADVVDELLAKSVLPRIGPAGRPVRYEAVNLRTGSVLQRSSAPVSDLVQEGDAFRLRAAPTADEGPAPRSRRAPGGFSLTGVAPWTLDRSTQYPVLAIRATCTLTGGPRLGVRRGPGSSGSVLLNGRPILAKEACFLTADRDGRFRWVSPHDARYYRPGLAGDSGPARGQRLTHYSLEESTEENADMIYPVRPFSITGVELDGFDPSKEYPVLAIDVDKYLPEEGTEQGGEGSGEAPPESLAFFLVGDDRGEFAWVGEDQCRLAPLRE